jgi:bifunctional non-homologous end joining protein LigD
VVARLAVRAYNFNVFFKYIQPCSPVLARSVPAGDDWQHEIKFDGFRVQAHIIGKTVRLYSRSGGQLSERYPQLVSALGELPTRSAIIDGEIVASDAAGMPDFWPLFLRSATPAELHVWAFDLLALDGKDLRKLALEARQRRLRALVRRFDCPVLLHSEAFDDGQALLRVAEKHGLEGVVSKRRDAPYRSGACRGWRKIKTTAWREANRERWRLFERN